jgi:hypothetical protein
VVALSSCEAELYAGSEAVKEGVLLKEMLQFIGMGEYRMELLLDAASTRALIHKKGPGRMKHLDVRALWMQDLVAAGGLSTKKIDRLLNLSDPLTHSPTALELEVFREGIGMRNFTHDEHERKADKHGQYFRAAVSAKETAKAVAAVILAATLKVARAEAGSAGGDPIAKPADWTPAVSWMIMLLVVVFVLAVRGAVALVEDLQRCCGRRLVAQPAPLPPPPSPPAVVFESPTAEPWPQPPAAAAAAAAATATVRYRITVPMQIKICKTTGMKYHARTCGEVSAARGRNVGTYTPCEKCIAVLSVPTGYEGTQ